MSDVGGLDLRLPIGGLFVALGIMLTGYGLATANQPDHYVRSGGLNINIWWGIVMLITGALFLLGARRGIATAKRPPVGASRE